MHIEEKRVIALHRKIFGEIMETKSSPRLRTLMKRLGVVNARRKRDRHIWMSPPPFKTLAKSIPLV